MSGRSLFLLSALFGAAAAGQSIELRRLDIRSLPTLVLEVRTRDGKGQDLAGIPAAGFDVRLDGLGVDGIVAEAAGATGPTPAPVLLLVDRSGDLSAAGGHAIRKAASMLADALPAGTPVAVFSFDARLKEECGLEADRERVKKAIVNIAPGDGTSYVEPLQAVARQAAALDPSRAVVLFLVHAQHYPGSAPVAGRAYSLPGHTTPIYPVVLQEGPDAELADVVARVVGRVAQGLPGIYRLTIPAQGASVGEMHTLSVALRSGGGEAHCRFKAVRGPATSPSSLLEAELADHHLVPWQGAFVGAILGGLGLLVLGRGSGPLRITPLMRLCFLGTAAVLGATLALLAFPPL